MPLNETWWPKVRVRVSLVPSRTAVTVERRVLVPESGQAAGERGAGTTTAGRGSRWP
mgnify:CR=1 FL=1